MKNKIPNIATNDLDRKVQYIFFELIKKSKHKNTMIEFENSKFKRYIMFHDYDFSLIHEFDRYVHSSKLFLVKKSNPNKYYDVSVNLGPEISQLVEEIVSQFPVDEKLSLPNKNDDVLSLFKLVDSIPDSFLREQIQKAIIKVL